MNLEISLKTQNLRSFNPSETGLCSMRTKIKATMLEGEDILLLTNTQIGRNRRVIEKEFLLGGDNPYEILTNSGASNTRSVLIAIRIQAIKWLLLPGWPGARRTFERTVDPLPLSGVERALRPSVPSIPLRREFPCLVWYREGTLSTVM